MVLLDIELPGVDGWVIAREIDRRDGKTGKKPLVVAISGFGSEEDRKRSDAAGIHLHLVKSADPEKLLGLLRRFDSLVA